MKRGRTIVAERERLETASERMQNREKMRRKRILSVCAVILAIIIVVIVAILIWQILNKHDIRDEANRESDITLTVEVIDETGVGLSNKTKEYIAFLEEDFEDLGYKIKKIVLPQDKSRELLVYLEEKEGYIKINVDRGSAVSAEDADRMMRYLEKQGSGFEYIDVRIEEKGYYK